MVNNKLSKLADYIIDMAWNGGNIRGFHVTIGDEQEIKGKVHVFTEKVYKELVDNENVDDRLYKIRRNGKAMSIVGRRRIMGEDNKYWGECKKMNVNHLNVEKKVIGAFYVDIFNKLIINNDIDTLEMNVSTIISLMEKYKEMNRGIDNIINAYKYREEELNKFLKSMSFYFDINDQYYNMCGKEIKIKFKDERNYYSGEIYMYSNEKLEGYYQLD